MMNTYMIKGIRAILFSIMFAFAAIISFDAYAISACAVKFNGNSVTPECPDGRKARYDISPKCIENANNSSGNCINTMPVTNVARIPEDVCFRGQGWGRKRNHNGMDYAAGMGTAVTAAMDGKITRFTFGTPEPARGVCQSSGGGYGNVIYIEHKGCDGTYTTRYGHLTNKIVPGLKYGATVKKGQLIGYVGGTGGACGRPHLHFELRGPGDALINPMCDQIQGVCNCKTPLPSSGLSKCKDATFAASSSTPIDPAAGVTAVSVAESDAKGFILKCDSYAEVRNGYRQWGCIFCKPFQILFSVASVMAYKSFNILAKAVVTVVLIGFALWLCFVTLKFVSSMEIKEPRIYVKTLLNQSFRVLFIVIILNSNLPYIMSSTIDPVFSTGMQVAQLAGKLSDSCDLGDEYKLPKTALTSEDVGSGESQGGLSEKMGNSILCTIKSIQDQISDILAFGSFTWCLSWTIENRILFVFPNLGYLLTSLLFYLGGIMLILIYPFLLVDCILKLAIAVSFMPAAIGAFAFKATEKYLKIVWEIFLNAVFSFIFLSIIIYIIASIAADIVSDIITDDSGVIARFFWWGVDALKVLTICLLGWAVLGEMKKFADSFAGSIDFQGKGGIGGATGSFANEFFLKRPGLAIGKPIMNTAMKAGKATKDGISERYHMHSINRWKKSAEGNANFFSRTYSRMKGGTTPLTREVRDENGNIVRDKNGKPLKENVRDENGNVVYDTTGIWQKLHGRKEYRTFETDSNGNVRMNIKKEYRNGASVETTTDAYATKKTIYDSNHGVISESNKTHTLMLKHITKDNGTINNQVVKDFMQNSLLSEEEKQIIIMQSIIKSRMGSYRGGKLEDATLNRTVEKSTDSKGREVWTVKQVNLDNSEDTFTLTFGENNRVMTEVKTVGKNGKGYIYATDGIMQRKSYISRTVDDNGDFKENIDKVRYSFSKYYSDKSSRPLYSNGDFANNIPHDQIMFGQEDIDQFASQVRKKGNKAYRFSEFN